MPGGIYRVTVPQGRQEHERELRRRELHAKAVVRRKKAKRGGKR